MSRIESSVSFAQRQVNQVERELKGIADKLRDATESFDWDAARKLRARKIELDERLPTLQANLLRVTFNEAQRAAEQRKQELENAKKTYLEAASINTKAYEFYTNSNRTLQHAAVDMAAAESKLATANSEVIEIGQQLEQHLERLSQ
jgi:DNA repair exonuclease SbcCD ATPase subunit